MKGRASSRWQARKCLKLSGVDVVYSYRDWATCGSGGPPFNMKPKVAIWIEGGMIQGIRASIDLDVEVLDLDVDWADEYAAIDRRVDLENKWETYQIELPFGVA